MIHKKIQPNSCVPAIALMQCCLPKYCALPHSARARGSHQAVSLATNSPTSHYTQTGVSVKRTYLGQACMYLASSMRVVKFSVSHKLFACACRRAGVFSASIPAGGGGILRRLRLCRPRNSRWFESDISGFSAGARLLVVICYNCVFERFVCKRTTTQPLGNELVGNQPA